jgi:Ca2+-binding EF-hand superfamily protein
MDRFGWMNKAADGTGKTNSKRKSSSSDSENSPEPMKPTEKKQQKAGNPVTSQKSLRHSPSLGNTSLHKASTNSKGYNKIVQDDDGTKKDNTIDSQIDSLNSRIDVSTPQTFAFKRQVTDAPNSGAPDSRDRDSVPQKSLYQLPRQSALGPAIPNFEATNAPFNPYQNQAETDKNLEYGMTLNLSAEMDPNAPPPQNTMPVSSAIREFNEVSPIGTAHNTVDYGKGPKKGIAGLPTILLNNATSAPRHSNTNSLLIKEMSGMEQSRQSQMNTLNPQMDYMSLNVQEQGIQPRPRKSSVSAMDVTNNSMISDKKHDFMDIVKNAQDKDKNKKGVMNTPDKNTIILPGYTKYIIDEDNNLQNWMPKFSEEDIKEAFTTLDLKKAGYITAEDLTFYLNDVLGEGATDAEIEEMIRMLDYQGMQRVRYDEFLKMATGKSISPIGQAYPPTMELFNKKAANQNEDSQQQPMKFELNLKHITDNQGLASGGMLHRPHAEPPRLMTTGDVNREGNHFMNTLATEKRPQGHQTEKYGGPQTDKHGGNGAYTEKHGDQTGKRGTDATKHQKTPAGGNMARSSMSKSSHKVEKAENIKYFMKNLNIEDQMFHKFIDRIKHMKQIEFESYSYDNFIKFFDADNDEFSKVVFEYLAGKGDNKGLDLRKFLTALIPFLECKIEDKLDYAYRMYDTEQNGYILLEELNEIFKVFQITEEPAKVEKKLTAILQKKSIALDEFISKEDFFTVSKIYPSLFGNN